MPGGRPTVMTEEVLRKLDDAWIARATIAEAALIADISEESIYKYKKDNPEYSKKIDELKNLTTLHARKNVNKEISKGNIGVSQWHLERRDPDYKPKSSNDVNIGAQKSLIDAILEAKKKEDK